MPGDALYDTDFYTWTQRQAELLAQLDDPRLDTENLAEEVAALGRTEVRAVTGNLLRALIDLIKLAANTENLPSGHRHSEIRERHYQARDAYTPGMRPLIDLDDEWRHALRIARRQLSDYGDPGVPPDLPCPFRLDDLLAPDFEPADACTQIERAIQAHGA
jgi:hypothetical protein